MSDFDLVSYKYGQLWKFADGNLLSSIGFTRCSEAFYSVEDQIDHHETERATCKRWF